MGRLTTFDYVVGCAVLLLALSFIVIAIAAGFKMAADARIEEVERFVERRAERKAREIVRERLDGCRIEVTQRIDVIEDDLSRG